MMRLINADDTIKREDAINSIYKRKRTVIKHDVLSYRDGLSDAIEIIQDLTSADRPQGKWLLSDLQYQIDNDNDNYAYVCTNCNHTDIHAKTREVPYCWWCGARMKGTDNETD